MFSERLKKNLYLRIGLVVVLGLAIPFFIVGFIEYRQVERQFLAEAKNEIQSSSQLMSLGLSRALWDLSKENVEAIVNASLSNPNIISVDVFDSKGHLFYHVQKDVKKVNSAELISTQAKILYGDREIGYFKINYTNFFIHQKLIHQTNLLIANRLIQIILSLVVLGLFIHYAFIRRLNRLMDHANLLRQRNLNDEFQWESGDALNELGRTLDEARLSLKKLVNEVHGKNDELVELNKKLENLVQEKSIQVVHAARMSALGEMAAGIAHEINNPLSVIMGRTTILSKAFSAKRMMTDEEVLIGLEKINKMSIRISKIVKSLRFFSRNAEYEIKKKVALASIFEDTLDLCLERMKNMGIEFRISSIPEITLECQNVQISQVFLNLINNSIDAIKNSEMKWISVMINVSSDKIVINFFDSGSGIPYHIADKMMNPFFTTKDEGQGTGLGLSISSGIIKEHGGVLYLDQKSANTCFVVELPIAKE